MTKPSDLVKYKHKMAGNPGVTVDMGRLSSLSCIFLLCRRENFRGRIFGECNHNECNLISFTSAVDDVPYDLL